MKKTDTYHHGHLREALLESARALVQEAGVDGLTLRAAARRAGVSTAAPYYHFANKAELIDALTQQSLEELDRVSREALAGAATPQEKLKAIGVVYVVYAVTHPAEFRLMFRADKGAFFATPTAAQAPVYGVLLEVIDGLHGEGMGGDPQTAAIAAWSLVHGLAALLIDGPLHALGSDIATVRTLAENVTGRLTLIN